MICPQCGTDMPDGARFCPKCGRDMAAAAPPPVAPAAATVPLPVAPAAAPAPAFAPPPTAAMPVAAPGVPMLGQPVQGQRPKKKPGLIIALVVLGLLLLCCVVAGIGAFFYLKAQTPVVQPTTSTGTTTKPPKTGTDTGDSAAVDAAQTAVEDYYAAINAADMEAIGAVLVPELAADLDPGMFEGWDSSTTFEFTRGMVDGDTATIYGRESVRAYGSGGDGGVKFTLKKSGESWLIASWTGADRTQIEGSDTTGSSTGVKGSLTEATARDVVTRVLEARQTGAANIVRQLTTTAFQDKNGDIWLDGSDNTEFFTSFQITGVTVSGKSAVVTVSEEWNSGTETGTYTVVATGGAVLVDSWDSQQ